MDIQKKTGTLRLTRKTGQSVYLDTSDGKIEVCVTYVGSNNVKLAITAPKTIRIARGELEEE